MAVLNVAGIGCPFQYVFLIPCPTCGVTRALIALLSADFAGYVAYNVMAIPLCIAVWLLLCADVFKRKHLVYGISGGILAINFVYYLVRIFF